MAMAMAMAMMWYVAKMDLLVDDGHFLASLDFFSFTSKRFDTSKGSTRKTHTHTHTRDMETSFWRIKNRALHFLISSSN